MSAPYRIPEEEYNARVKKLIPTLIPKGRADGGETKELFTLYNDRFQPFENGQHCPACRSRVYKKMLTYYESIKNK